MSTLQWPNKIYFRTKSLSLIQFYVVIGKTEFKIKKNKIKLNSDFQTKHDYLNMFKYTTRLKTRLFKHDVNSAINLSCNYNYKLSCSLNALFKPKT